MASHAPTAVSRCTEISYVPPFGLLTAFASATSTRYGFPAAASGPQLRVPNVKVEHEATAAPPPSINRHCALMLVAMLDRRLIRTISVFEPSTAKSNLWRFSDVRWSPIDWLVSVSSHAAGISL